MTEINEQYTARPSYYENSPFNSADVQAYIGSNTYNATQDFEVAMWICFAVKHLLRMGLKDDVKLEMLKAENYLHKARTGEFLKEIE